MKLTHVLLAATLGLSATAVLAWPGARYPDASQRPVPVDTVHAKAKKPNSNTVTVKVEVRNNTQKPIECDVFGTMRAYRNGDSSQSFVDVRQGVDRVLLEDGSFETTVGFVFKSAYFGQGFKPSKASQRVSKACKDLSEPGQYPGTGEPPHQSCDPEFEDCGFSCQADRYNPAACASADEPWSDDLDDWL